MNFQYYFEKKICFDFYRTLGEVYIFEYEECILMFISGSFVTWEYVISIWYSNLRVLIPELNQSKSALHQRWSALNTQFSQFRKTLLNSADSVLILTETALKFSCLGDMKVRAEQFCFRAVFLWTSAEHSIFRAQKNTAEQRWFRVESLWNSAEVFISEQRLFRKIMTYQVRNRADQH